MDVYCFKQLRRIAKDPVHVNRAPHTAFLRRFGLIDPLQELERRGIQTLAVWEGETSATISQWYCSNHLSQHIAGWIGDLAKLHCNTPWSDPIAEVEKTYPCEHCDKFFHHQGNCYCTPRTKQHSPSGLNSSCTFSKVCEHHGLFAAVWCCLSFWQHGGR